MKKEEIIEKASSLRKQIEEANRLYYSQDTQSISDFEYDELMRELEELEGLYPWLEKFFNTVSPTAKVGYEIQEEFKPHMHIRPMLSLANVLELDGLNDFFKSINTTLQPKEDVSYTIEYKYDGVSLSLIYIDGKLAIGSTRGDGVVGENVTSNVKTISNIPQSLNTDYLAELGLSEQIEIRGEVVIKKEDFYELNKKRESEGLSLFSNPRNCASGSLRQLDPSITASRPLTFFAYDIYPKDSLVSQSDSISLLRKLGFDLQNDLLISSSVDSIVDYYEASKLRREQIPFEIDGLVLKVNLFSFQEILGFRSRSPRWAVALKFPPRVCQTNLNSISWQVGRTGVVTPVAELEPVNLDGVIVKRATLHNISEIQAKDIRVGDKVLVSRQGDVIPAVIEVDKSKRVVSLKETMPPQKCPVCQIDLIEEGVGARLLYCPNVSCKAKLTAAISHLVSKKAFDIENIGSKLVEKLVASSLVEDLADLFTLSKEDFLSIEGVAEKSASNFCEEISKKKKVSFSRFIYALGIRNVGEVLSRQLATLTKDVEVLSRLSEEELVEIDDIGEVTAKTLHVYFSSTQFKNLYQKFIDSGVEIISPGNNPISETLADIVFVITGSFEDYKRHDIKKLIEDSGGKVVSSVSKKTSYLIAGEKPGSKLEKAQDLGIEILTITEFLKMLE